MSTRRYDSVLAALRRGEDDDRSLSGRHFNEQYWRNARRQLNVLRRELDVLRRENEALRACIDEEPR